MKKLMTTVLLSLSALFAFRRFDIDPSFEDDAPEPLVDSLEEEINNIDPRVEIYYEHDCMPRYYGPIKHEIKIDLAGRVYFKIRGRWSRQEDVEEINAYKLLTAQSEYNKSMDEIS